MFSVLIYIYLYILIYIYIYCIYKIQLIPVMEKLNFQCHMIQCHIHVPDLLSILKTVVLILIFLWKLYLLFIYLTHTFEQFVQEVSVLTENRTINLFKTCSKPKIYIFFNINISFFLPIPGFFTWQMSVNSSRQQVSFKLPSRMRSDIFRRTNCAPLCCEMYKKLL